MTTNTIVTWDTKLWQELWLSAREFYVGDIAQAELAVVLLHGAVWGASNALPMMRHNHQFALPSFQVALDLRDRTSSIPVQKFAQEIDHVFAQGFEKIATALPKDALILVLWNSFGGAAAMRLAQHYSADIGWVVLVWSAGFGENLQEVQGLARTIVKILSAPEFSPSSKDWTQQYLMKQAIVDLVNMHPDKVSDELINASLDLAFHYDQDTQRYYDRNRRQFDKFNTIKEYLGTLGVDNITNPYRTILKNLTDQHKLVVVIGWENDTVTPPETIQQQAQAALTQAHIIPHAGHATNIEEPQKVIDIINQELASYPY